MKFQSLSTRPRADGKLWEVSLSTKHFLELHSKTELQHSPKQLK